MTIDRTLPNGGSIPLDSTPDLAAPEFRRRVLEGVTNGARIAALFGCPEGDSVRLFSILAWEDTGLLSVLSTTVKDRYPSLTPDCPQAHLFERELAEQWRITPEGHPWLKPVRFQTPMRGKSNEPLPTQCGVADFFQMTGEEVHEVAVGPVHAGIIEPGHFRFQCHGETVHHLEISLGYQHRGIEKALAGGPDKRTLHYMETLAGDTTIGHTTAYCRTIEALTKSRVPARAQVVRGIALELERIANHIGDLGALAGDIGFLPTMSYCGRIRGDVLNLTALLCGNRFGRRLIEPGGTGYDLTEDSLAQLRDRLKTAITDAEQAISLLWKTPSVLARFEGAGPISRKTAEEIGLVGVSARACGLERDVRRDFPYGIFQMAHIPIVTWHTGDVFARAFVRWLEIERSAMFILDQLESLPARPPAAPFTRQMSSRHLALALVEGWRGEICHVAVTNEAGRFACYKIVDPSFHNWFGLALALREQQISDFPLCNKSFNLSYCGHDL
ncbi:MAG: hydrogenase [Verrucomicrobia bacterium]|nr:hydrogenase [Verrucomicrobiota bacterium]